MTCPQLYFNHSGSFSSDIAITTRFLEVGLVTTIHASLHNGSTFDGMGSVALYWVATRDGLHLDLPATQLVVLGQSNPLPPAIIPAGGSYQFSYPWAPSNSVKSDPADPNQLVIFAQAIASPVLGSGGDACAGWWNSSDFNPAATYNGAQKFPFSSVPFTSLPPARDGSPTGQVDRSNSVRNGAQRATSPRLEGLTLLPLVLMGCGGHGERVSRRAVLGGLAVVAGETARRLA